jgi:hypothetical protein
MGIVNQLRNLDRRIIFITIALAVAIPIIANRLGYPFRFPMTISLEVQSVYDAIEELPPGSRVLFSYDYGASTIPELRPMSIAMLHHCFRRDLKVVSIALWPQGAQIATGTFAEVAPQYGKTYGEDYLNLGYKSGGLVVITKIGRDMVDLFNTDLSGRPVSEFPIMNGISKVQDFDFVMDLSAGDPGIPYWVMIAQARYHVRLAGGCTAVSAAQFYPYINTGQLIGLLGGLKGAAEYEALVERTGKGIEGMDSQSVAHILIILLIIMANITYLSERRKKKAKEG